MASLFSRKTEIENSTGVVLEIREVERGDESGGTLFATMQPKDCKVIKAKTFLDRSSYDGVPRTVHVSATTAKGTKTTMFLPAQFFANHERIIFKLDGEKLVAAEQKQSTESSSSGSRQNMG
ncbi:Hypothetical predicted protein [Prunus dulcis]|uniref:Uncharacterized protein n=1 Tax=Prunus dulcis TaxID=3755 RepID=A0A5E4EI23_PRUDU|nr:uncharacterized protein LOC117619069 [Prunus dulcis]VVA15046.1 Hypothetical predicted protein [Prunus dulcis]